MLKGLVALFVVLGNFEVIRCSLLVVGIVDLFSGSVCSSGQCTC